MATAGHVTLERCNPSHLEAANTVVLGKCRAKQRQRNEMGTLGSGNHYLEVQRVAQVYDAATAAAFALMG